MPRPVSVVIPHARATSRLQRCVASLSSDRILEILVVLPESAAKSVQMLERHENVRAVQTPTLVSFASATNLGASVATGEILMLLNDDTIVQAGAIEQMADALISEPEVGIAGALLLNTDGSVQPSMYVDPSWRAVVEVVAQPLFRRWPLRRYANFPYLEMPKPTPQNAWLSGAALMISRQLYQEVGGLDEGYPHGIEDAALCRAVRERGRQVVIVTDARIVHEGGVSGFRTENDSDQVAAALVKGTEGWIRYWRAYRNGGWGSILALRAAFFFFGVSRLAVFVIMAAAIRGRRGEAHRVRRNAYRRYVHLMLALRR